MAAYAALLSVMHIIENLQCHPRPPITIDEAQRQPLTQKIAFLQDFLESYNFHGGIEQLENLQSRIADAAHAAEDLIESHIVDQIYLSRSIREWEETSGFKCLQKLIDAIDFIKGKVREIIKEKMEVNNHPFFPTTLNKKQVEYEKIAILKDFVKSYHSREVSRLLQLLAADASIESDRVDQIVTANNDMLQNLFRAYNSHGDECLCTRIADAAYAAEDTHTVLDLIFGRSIYTHGGGKNASSVDFYQRLQKVIDDMDLIEREVEEIRNKVGPKYLLPITVKETVVSSRSLSEGQNIMVGFDDLLYQILE